MYFLADLIIIGCIGSWLLCMGFPLAGVSRAPLLARGLLAAMASLAAEHRLHAGYKVHGLS